MTSWPMTMSYCWWLSRKMSQMYTYHRRKKCLSMLIITSIFIHSISGSKNAIKKYIIYVLPSTFSTLFGSLHSFLPLHRIDRFHFSPPSPTELRWVIGGWCRAHQQQKAGAAVNAASIFPLAHCPPHFPSQQLPMHN